MSVHTITAVELNEIENQFSPHGLGFEKFVDGEFTYNQVIAAIDAGYHPCSFIDGGWKLLLFCRARENYYCVWFDDLMYEASDPDTIMTQYENPDEGTAL